MDFKFIVLALVFSTATGEDSATQKLVSTIGFTNKSLSVDAIKHPDVASPSHETVASERVNNVTSIIHSYKVLQETTPVTATTPDLTTVITEKTSVAPNTIPTTSNNLTATPMPSPEEGQWNVKNKAGVICIIAQMELQFNLTYPGKNNIKQNGTVFVPKNSSASGNCSNSSQRIRLKWGEENSFEIVFGLNKTSAKFEILSLNLTINVTEFKDVDVDTTFMTYVSNKVKFPAVPVKMSYKCDKQQMQQLNSTTNFYSANMLVSHTQLEAFTSKNNAVFSEAEDCEGFETPDIVPIAVGCVLSILVVIVLIAYLIGRRRSQNRGYLSM